MKALIRKNKQTNNKMDTKSADRESEETEEFCVRRNCSECLDLGQWGSDRESAEVEMSKVRKDNKKGTVGGKQKTKVVSNTRGRTRK